MNEIVEKIYTPSPFKPMQIAVFGSGTGTNLEAVLAAQMSYSNLFSVEGVFCDKKCRCLDIGKARNIPVVYLPYDKEKHQTKENYEKAIIHEIRKWDFKPDIIFLAGYMRLVKEPLLETFHNRILNVHPADLTICDDSGNRKYIGLNAVSDALNDGQSSTRSSVFLVNQGVDAGQIITLGLEVPYTDGYPLTVEKIDKHQQKQKRLSDWVATVEALKLLAEGRVGLNKRNNIVIDHKEGYYLCAESSLSLTSNR